MMIKYDPNAGLTIAEAAAVMCNMSRKAGLPVNASFNDVELIAYPTTSAKDIVDEYHAKYDPSMRTNNFERELRDLLNKHSKEGGSDTPDFILARYLVDCLKVYDNALKMREGWYSRPVGGSLAPLNNGSQEHL